MPLNKIVLDTDGLEVGYNQLVTSGNSVFIGNTLVVAGEFYAPGLSRNVTLSQEFNSNNVVYNSNGFITAYTEGFVRTANVVYNSNGSPTSWTETDFSYPASNVSYSYAVTYDSQGYITNVNRTKL